MKIADSDEPDSERHLNFKVIMSLDLHRDIDILDDQSARSVKITEGLVIKRQKSIAEATTTITTQRGSPQQNH